MLNQNSDRGPWLVWLSGLSASLRTKIVIEDNTASFLISGGKISLALKANKYNVFPKVIVVIFC